MSKIAISSQGKSMESQVDPRFGRAAYFLVVDEQSGSFEVVDNTISRDMSTGAGIQAAEAVARAGAKTLLSGIVGPKALHALQAAGVQAVQGAEGSVEEALQAYRAGSAGGATVSPGATQTTRMAQGGTSAGAGRGLGPCGGGMGPGGGRGTGGGMGPGGGRGRGRGGRRR